MLHVYRRKHKQADCIGCGQWTHEARAYDSTNGGLICQECVHDAGHCVMCRHWTVVERCTDGTKVCQTCIGKEMALASTPFSQEILAL